MIVAVLAAVIPVLVGSLLATSPRLLSPSRLGPARTFALFAALAVVLTELLPGAAAQTGAVALGLFAVGLALPAIAERVIRGRPGEHSTAGEEIAFAALCLHQLVDGVEVGVAWSVSAGAWAVTLAIAAHSVPLLAAVLLEFARHGTRRNALLRGAVLAICTGIGAAVGHGGADLLPGAEAWLPALLAGLLIHVLWHHHDEPAPASLRARWADLAGAVAGFCLPVALMGLEGHAPSESSEFVPALVDLTRSSAPTLLFGLALAAVGQTIAAPQRVGRWFGSLWSGLAGLATGGVWSPSAAGEFERRARGVGEAQLQPAFVVVLVLGTPVLGFEAIALSARLMGVELAVGRVFVGVAAALLAAGVVTVLNGESAGSPGRESSDAEPVHRDPPSLRRVWTHFEALLLHVGPFFVAGLVLAGLVQAFVSPGDASALAASGLSVPAAVVLSGPAYVSGSGVVPVAAVLWAKGLTPGAVLVVLVLGPATSIAALGVLVKSLGRRLAAAALTSYLLVVGGAGYILDGAGLEAGAPALIGPGDGPAGAFSSVLAALLCGLFLRSAWRVGPRAWLAEITAADGDEHHGHSHDHSSGHGPDQHHDHASDPDQERLR